MCNKYTTYKDRCLAGAFNGTKIRNHRGPLDVFGTEFLRGSHFQKAPQR